jgi:uncharacterized iron-regulated protein
MKKALLILVVCVPFLMYSCGGETETKVITTSTISLVEDYPMEGANTLTSVWSVNLDGIDAGKVKSARVTSIRFEMVDPEDSNALEEITVLLAASGADMQKVAVLNPVPQNTNTFQPNIAASQKNLAALLQQAELTLVADINLKEDLDGELALNAVITFEIEVKQ